MQNKLVHLSSKRGMPGMDPNLVKSATLDKLQTLLLMSTILLGISVAMVRRAPSLNKR